MTEIRRLKVSILERNVFSNLRGQTKHINFFNINFLAPTQNPRFWTPRKKFMCLISWERTQKRHININFSGGFGGSKTACLNGPLWATKSLVYCFFLLFPIFGPSGWDWPRSGEPWSSWEGGTVVAGMITELPILAKIYFQINSQTSFSGHVIPYLTGNQFSIYLSAHVICFTGLLPGFHPRR